MTLCSAIGGALPVVIVAGLAFEVAATTVTRIGAGLLLVRIRGRRAAPCDVGPTRKPGLTTAAVRSLLLGGALGLARGRRVDLVQPVPLDRLGRRGLVDFSPVGELGEYPQHDGGCV